jgi:lysozyme family protein
MAQITDALISYLQKSEGGLSRSTKDTASKYPSPYVYNGQSGWHTNKGITYQTFESSASGAGYSVTADNFLKMPNDIWGKILKMYYWDPMYCNLYESQAIANAVVDFAWASGTGGSKKALIKYLGKKGIKVDGAVSIAKAFNNLAKKDGELQVFNDLIDERKRFFKSLNQPANEKGWLNRMETLRKEGAILLKDIVSSTGGTGLLIAAGLIVGMYFIFKK